MFRLVPSRRVCFVTCLAWPDISDSDRYVQRALEARDVAVTGIPWNAPERRFDGFGAVVFRSSWDYHHEPEVFLDWLARWEAEGVRFWNPPDLVRWNLSKRYLLDLARRGVNVVPTVMLEEPASLHLPAVMAQPFVADIRTRGEWSMVFIDGELTHATLKRPAREDFRVQPSHGGTSIRANPPLRVAEAGRRALDALPITPLYARVDGVDAREGFLVMELEVHEPGLYFEAAPEAALVFADAIMRRL